MEMRGIAWMRMWEFGESPEVPQEERISKRGLVNKTQRQREFQELRPGVGLNQGESREGLARESSQAAHTRSCCLGSPDCVALFSLQGFYILKMVKQAQAPGIIVCVLLSVQRDEHDGEGQVRAGTANLADPVAFLQPNDF